MAISSKPTFGPESLPDMPIVLSELTEPREFGRDLLRFVICYRSHLSRAEAAT